MTSYGSCEEPAARRGAGRRAGLDQGLPYQKYDRGKGREMTKREICVIGAGNGGSAIAGDLTLAGHACRLFEFEEYAENIRPLSRQWWGCATAVFLPRVVAMSVRTAVHR